MNGDISGIDILHLTYRPLTGRGYRHALALDEAGERLAFGSTTGGLWISEDQGDSWTCVTHTLPPVYAVRFA